MTKEEVREVLKIIEFHADGGKIIDAKALEDEIEKKFGNTTIRPSWKVSKAPYPTCHECRQSGLTFVCWDNGEICENYERDFRKNHPEDKK